MLLLGECMSIQVLPEHVIAKIAAGEVIERPASVVKELIENALDAGATYIQAEIHGDGRRSIRVSDNGSGIPADEVETAFARHATSKLTRVEDLEHIRTLGFRGEALASIAAVSRVSVTTRHHEEPMGTDLLIEGGSLRTKRSVGTPAGTVLAVENLFFNTPARLKFLKSEATEKRQIALVVMRYAMAYPMVRFVLEQDGREYFRSSGSGYLGDVLVNTLGLSEFKNMLEVEAESITAESGLVIRVQGFTSTPNLNRSDRSRITLFINGRWIQDTSLTYAVIQAYHTLLMTGRYPVAVLMIDLPPDEVDVNVHPTKAEVRFRSPDAVFAAVQRAVRRAVIDHAQTPALRSLPSALQESHWESGRVAGGRQMAMRLGLESPGQFARRGDALPLPDADDPTAIPEGPEAPAQPRTLPMLRVVGQVGASYIVAEGPAGVYLIDQHAAHERILYEQFMAEYVRQEQVIQHTLEAQTIQLAPAESHLVEGNLESLYRLGFWLEAFGPNTFIIRSVPALLADGDPLEVIAGIVSDLEAGSKPGERSIEDKIVLRVCKQAAVKAGQILSNQEMQALIHQLERCQSPLTCPHGRPTMIHISSERLEREFGRT